jgi:hypothetical protein
MVELAPAVVVVGVGVAGVFLAMNILVTAPPVSIALSPTPARSVGPSFPATPSGLPFDTPAPTDTPAPAASLSDQQPRFVHSVITESDPNGAWTVYLTYPAFVTGQTPWAQQIDSDMRAELTTRASQWELGPAADRSASGKKNTLTDTFVTDLISPTLASWTLTFVDNSLPSGPTTTVESIVYDLATGQRMVLGDIFIDSVSAATLLSNVTPVILKSQLGTSYDATRVTEGTTPQLTNWNNWAVTQAGLKVTFDQYQVTDGPEIVAIVVPWSQLATVMNLDGPVARLAGL